MNWYRPAVMAGKFYPKEKSHLTRMLTDFHTPVAKTKEKMRAIFVPHSGYRYCGKIAGDVYKQIEIPSTVIILSPNHTGKGPFLSFWDEGSWDTPLGKVHVHAEMAEKLRVNAGEIHSDMMGHLSEHSIEVQLPFLQFQNPHVKIVPIVLGPLRLENCKKLGESFAKTLKDEKDFMIVVSTDMTHYQTAEVAKQKDDLALEKVLAMDPEGLYQVVEENQMSMCGFIPMAAALFTLKALGNSEAKLVSYGNSARINHDLKSVVSYASGTFK